MTPHGRPFRFGVEMKGPFPDRTWPDSARELEDLGYSTLFVPDHVHSGLGPITAMATAAAATSTLRVAPLVLACDFRHPAVLAKELASIDLLSGGRLEVGVGAGYNPLDYSRTGIRMDPPGRRVDRLIEYVRILRLLFGGEVADFEGDEFTLREITGNPLPATPGGPPILIAGGGPRLLRFAAAEADIVGVNPTTAAGRESADTFRDALPASIDRKIELVRGAAGERWPALELNAWISTAAVTDAAGAAVAHLAGFAGVPEADVLASPIVLVGSPDEIAARLHERRERWGYSYICLSQAVAHDFAPLVARLTGT